MPVDSVDGVDKPAVHDPKAQKEEPTCEAAAPAYVGSGKGNGLRLPFLCVQVIGGPGSDVNPHPSEPFE
jgi:hypothetical protein